MKVSVLIVTYNQEKYISQAIASVLAQEANFAYEIVIGEDGSTDSTRAIVLDFQRQYPETIRPLLQEPAAAERDRAQGFGGKTNFVQTLQACRGEYIAWLDGDDYWTDINKLQKQVDFLDTHSDFAISYHNAKMDFVDQTREPECLLPESYRKVSTLEHLIFANFVPTCSVVFRNRLLVGLPEWFLKLKLGDWPLHIMNSQYGKIGYIDDVMAVYRVHGSGSWLSLGSEGQHLEVVKMLNYIDSYLGFKYKTQIRSAKAIQYQQLAEVAYTQSERTKGRRYLARYFWCAGFKERWALFSLFLRLHAPLIYRSLRTLRGLVRSGMGGRSGGVS